MMYFSIFVALLVSIVVTTAAVAFVGDAWEWLRRPAHGFPTYRRAARDLGAVAGWIRRRLRDLGEKSPEASGDRARRPLLRTRRTS